MDLNELAHALDINLEDFDNSELNLLNNFIGNNNPLFILAMIMKIIKDKNILMNIAVEFEEYRKQNEMFNKRIVDIINKQSKYIEDNHADLKNLNDDFTEFHNEVIALLMPQDVEPPPTIN